MAESTVSFFVEKLSNLVVKEASLFGQVEGQIKLLRNELEWMRLFLKDADSKRRYDENIKLWVNQIRDVTYEAEDVIDEFFYKMDYQGQKKLSNLKFLQFLKFLPTCICFPHKLPFIHELDSRVKEINVTIEAIMANRSKYGLEALTASSSSSTDQVVSHREKRPPVVEESDVVEIKDAMEFVKQTLMQGEMRRAVVSIVGMGGLGKTTLAKKVYNQSDVKRHFDCQAWVFVSQEFKTRELLHSIAKGVGVSLLDEEKDEINELGKKLCDHLQNKRYLIVMDDIWSVGVWKSLGLYLPESMNGSKVLITTRNKEIAMYVDPQAVPYELRALDDGESWKLFTKKTFRMGRTTATCPRDLEELGKKIVAKCKGLPLAIVVLGGLLSMKEKTQSSWERVLASIDWHLNQGPESCMGILALSYNDLPYYLKSCFLYCGIFPEDSEIKANKLIRLWVAEGFIQRRGKETLEDIAEDYLHELMHRSLIQVAKRRLDGGVKSCRLHDLLRDLAISEAKDAKLFEVHENIDITFPISVRRLIIGQHLTQNNISQCLHNSQLRSLIVFSEALEEKGWGSLHEHIKLLTVLDLGTTDKDNYMLPKEIGELIHLKFLCIKGFERVMLPSSIDRLINLQSLDLGWKDSRLPCSIWKLQQLRHLNCCYGKISSQSKRSRCVNGYLGVEQLTNLQTLALLAGNWLEGDGLGKLTRLRKLEVGGCLTPYLKSGFFESIAELTALRTLYLSDSIISQKETFTHHLRSELQWNVIEKKTLFPGLMSFSGHTYLYKVLLHGKLEKLPMQTEFYPPNLLKLTLIECGLRNDPMMILEKLPSLRILKLWYLSYVGKKMVCSSGGFLRLKSLELYALNELEEWIVEEGAMSNLNTLEILSCEKLKKLPRQLLQLTNLEKLKLIGESSDELIREIKEAEGEDWLKLCQIMS